MHMRRNCSFISNHNNCNVTKICGAFSKIIYIKFWGGISLKSPHIKEIYTKSCTNKASHKQIKITYSCISQLVPIVQIDIVRKINRYLLFCSVKCVQFVQFVQFVWLRKLLPASRWHPAAKWSKYRNLFENLLQIYGNFHLKYFKYRILRDLC